MPPARWLRSAGAILLPAPRWVPWERQLGPPWQSSWANGGPAVRVQHSARHWCQSRREEPRMNGDQKSVFAQDKQDFVQHFSQIVKILTEDGMEHPEVGDAIARLKKLQAFFLVTDDIMDASLTRRGQPCWYKKPGIGLDAINDAMLLEACIYRLLKHYCHGQPYYMNLIELFLQSTYQTEIGQTLDLITAPQGKVDLTRFTEQRYKTIVKYKTAFYSFYLPFAAAMYMAGIDGEKEHANAKNILLDMGEFFQIQDDYLDLFGDPSVTGKIGTDIQDNKCSWLVVKCLQLASSEQRKMLEETYGQKDPEKVAKVKELYEKLELPAHFTRFEEESYSRLMGLIEKHSSPLPPSIFLEMAKKIYKRQK
ncbi:farnesyl pyrophosphate synthase isoform X2 [Petaurus breviceps papuanus]|uniref:farnesyl pyrophosphate synthase isoform X2 n=1 Tax=Petaurus breviceps papuanus TaxID=3040969 RepID=UPI0036D92245